MTRPLRIQHEGGWYHVINRGIAREAIFRDVRDRVHFVELLGGMSARYGLEVHAYVLMDNHYHVIVRAPDVNLSRGMQWLNVSYSIWHNRRHDRVGPLFQGRFKSVPVEGGRWVYTLSQYVHLNPVRVKWLGLDKRGRRREGLGLSKAASTAEAAERLAVLRAHRWSTYGCYAGYGQAPEWLRMDVILARTGASGAGDQKAAYRKALEDYVRGGYEESWSERLRNRLAVGADVFIQRVKQSVGVMGREWPQKRILRRRVGFDEVVKAVEKVKGEPWQAFVDRQGDWGRDMVFHLCRQATGMTLRELGEAAGGLDYAAVSVAIRRMGQRLREDSALQDVKNRVAKMLNV